MRTLIFFMLLTTALWIVIHLLNRLSGLRDRQKIDKLMQSVYTTGRISHGNRVYSVRDICNYRPHESKPNNKAGYLVVSKLGDTKIFKVPIEEAKPYNGASIGDTSLLYR